MTSRTSLTITTIEIMTRRVTHTAVVVGVAPEVEIQKGGGIERKRKERAITAKPFLSPTVSPILPPPFPTHLRWEAP
jgi:hypothetical protein